MPTDAAPDRRAGVIAAVRTPLGLAALLVLTVEAVLIPLATRSSGTDRTILVVGLVGVLVVVLAPVIVVAWRNPELLFGPRARRDEPAEWKYDTFISAPMAGFGHDARAYQRSRADVLRLIQTLNDTGNARNAFYAGRFIKSLKEFETSDLSLETDLDALRQSRSLIFIYPAPMPTSALIELGVAIGLKKPVIIHVLDGVDLPYLLQHDEGATDTHGPIHIYRYANFSDILQIYRSNPGILDRLDHGQSHPVSPLAR